MSDEKLLDEIARTLTPYRDKPDVAAWFARYECPLSGDERIRRIVREEIGKLPIAYDVPDTPQ